MPKRVISTHNVPWTDPFAGTIAVLGLDDNVIMTVDPYETTPTWAAPWAPTSAAFLSRTITGVDDRGVELERHAGVILGVGLGASAYWALHPDGRIAVYAPRTRMLAVEMWAPDDPPPFPSADLEAIARAPGRLRDRRLVECIAEMPLGSEASALMVADMANAYNGLVRMARYIAAVDQAEDAADALRAPLPTLYRVRAGDTVQLNGAECLVLRSAWSDSQKTLDVKLQAVAGPGSVPAEEGS